MTKANFEYLGPIQSQVEAPERVPVWRKVPLAFAIVVIMPTLLAAIYLLLIASPRYVSESRFIVRQPSQPQPSGLGVALQGIGISSGQTDAFAVHEYIKSRAALTDMSKKFDVREMLRAEQADILSRYPRPWESQSSEGLYKSFRRFVVVGYDATTGISTLRVEAFRRDDAQRMANELLSGGEALVNRLNDRAAKDAVQDAMLSQEQARQRLDDAQRALTAFRNRQRFVDPVRTAAESSQLIGGLMEQLAVLRAERRQVAAGAPQSPSLAALDSRIVAFEQQIREERAKVAGEGGSLAPLIGDYEKLVLNRELADKELVQATAALLGAQQDARRQRLYLERVVDPSLPDQPSEPRRLRLLLTVFLSALIAYAVGWLIWAGIREHRQD